MKTVSRILALSLFTLLLCNPTSLSAQSKNDGLPIPIYFEYNFWGKPIYYSKGEIIPEVLGKKYFKEFSPNSLLKIDRGDESRSNGYLLSSLGGAVIGFGFSRGPTSTNDGPLIAILAGLSCAIVGVMTVKKANRFL